MERQWEESRQAGHAPVSAAKTLHIGQPQANAEWQWHRDVTAGCHAKCREVAPAADPPCRGAGGQIHAKERLMRLPRSP